MAVNFDSPSAAAAFGALQIGSGMDLNLQGLGGLASLTRSTEDERAKRLEEVIAILGVSPPLAGALQYKAANPPLAAKPRRGQRGWP